MMHRKLFCMLVLLLSLSCQKKSESSTEKNDEATADAAKEAATADKATGASEEGPGTPADFLVGKWSSDCIDQAGNLQASIIQQYEFTADGNASTKTISYAAAGCTKRFTKTDVETLVTQINADRAVVNSPPLSPAELAAFDALWFPPANPFSFKLGKTLKDQTVEMNATQKLSDQSINSYLTIYVENGFLYFAELCSKADFDSQRCNKIVGDSVKNRARDMTNAIPFHKI